MNVIIETNFSFSAMTQRRDHRGHVGWASEVSYHRISVSLTDACLYILYCVACEIHAWWPPLIARFMGPTWGRQDPGGPHVGPWTLLSGTLICHHPHPLPPNAKGTRFSYLWHWGGKRWGWWWQMSVLEMLSCIGVMSNGSRRKTNVFFLGKGVFQQHDIVTILLEQPSRIQLLCIRVTNR